MLKEKKHIIHKKGISLIVLIVTIIIMIILATVVILNLKDENISEKALKTTFKNDLSNFVEELDVTIASKRLEASARGETYDPAVYGSDLRHVEVTDPNDLEEMKKYIPSFNKKYAFKLVIHRGKIAYVGGEPEEAEWAAELGIYGIPPE